MKITKDLKSKNAIARWARLVQMNGYCLWLCGEFVHFPKEVIDAQAKPLFEWKINW